MTPSIGPRFVAPKPSVEGRRPGVPLVGADRGDVGELGDRVPHLGLGVEEVRPEPDPTCWVGAKVADDPALAELRVTGGVVRGRDGDRPAAPLELPRRDDPEPRL